MANFKVRWLSWFGLSTEDRNEIYWFALLSGPPVSALDDARETPAHCVIVSPQTGHSTLAFDNRGILHWYK